MNCLLQFFVTDIDCIQPLSGILQADFEIQFLSIMFFYIVLQHSDHRRPASDGVILLTGKYHCQTAVAAGFQDRIPERGADSSSQLPDDLPPVLTDLVQVFQLCFGDGYLLRRCQNLR